MEYRSTASVPSIVQNGKGFVQARTTIHQVHPHLKPGQSTAADYLQRVERSPRRAAALERARQRAAGPLEAADRRSLAQLRLAAGLSQAQLAAKMGTQQPNIARWEREPKNMTVETLLRLGEALGVAPATVIEAIKASQG